VNNLQELKLKRRRPKRNIREERESVVKEARLSDKENVII
jgi:hypothetical protein